MYFLTLVMTCCTIGKVFPNEVTIRDLEIFKPITPYLAGVDETGQVYILDRAECRVLVFDADGNSIQTMGRKGNGPGEFQWPLYLTVGKGKVIVYEGTMANIFNTNGAYMNQVPRNPKSLSYIIGNSEYLRKSEDDSMAIILRRDLDTGHEETLLAWQPERLIKPQKPYTHGAGKASYSPIRENIFFVASHSRRYLFIGHMGPQFRITVLDLEKNKQHVIKRSIKPIPFNKEWGQADIDARNRQGGEVKLYLSDIKNFPLIRNLWSGPGDEIVVSLWTGMPDTTTRHLVFTPEGKDTELDFDPQIIPRLIGVHQNYAWIAAQDEDVSYLVRARLDQLDQIAKVHAWQEKADGPRKTFLPLKIK